MNDNEVQVVLKQPIKVFLFISFATVFVGLLLDLNTYTDTEVSSLLNIKLFTNIGAIILNIIAILLFLYNKSYLKFAAGVLMYSVFANFIITNFFLFLNDVPIWQFTLLRDSFIIAAFITVSVYIFNNIHVVILNFIYASFMIMILIYSEPNFVTRHAIFMVLMIASFSLGIGMFMKKLKESIKEKSKLQKLISEQAKELLIKDNELIVEKSLSLDKEINQKNKELVSRAMSIVQHEEDKVLIIKKLKNIKSISTKEVMTEIQSIIQEMTLSSDKTYWKEFQTRFEDVHQDFYDVLYKEFPKLSPAEIRLAAFIKLGLSSKEIAHLINNTKESVDVARSRLRKKMNVKKSENFIVFLSKL